MTNFIIAQYLIYLSESSLRSYYSHSTSEEIPCLLIFILILSSYLHLELQSDLFSSEFLTKMLYPHIVASMCATCLTYHILDLIKLGDSSLCSLPSLLSPFFLRYRYSSQHPILRYPQSVFFIEYEVQSFTVQNSRLC